MRNVKNADKLYVVLDTNVLVSALQFPNGSVAGIFEALTDGRFCLVLSPAIVAETARILRTRFDWQDERVQATLKLLARRNKTVSPRRIPDAVPNDPDDNHIIACALEGGVDLIVSGDRDLLSLGEYAGIPIIRPVDFLRTVDMPT